MDTPKGLKEEVKYTSTSSAGTHHLFDDICTEVENLVENGTVPISTLSISEWTMEKKKAYISMQIVLSTWMSMLILSLPII